MKFDFKITTWERVEVPEELEAAVLAKIESGDIWTTNQVLEFVEDMGGRADWEIIPECEEYITPEENGGAATIEVMEDGEFLYTNSKTEGNEEI